MSGSTFGYSRAHSSDSGPSRHSVSQFYRVSSLPRYSKSPSRYSPDYYSSEFGFNGNLVHNTACTCNSMSSGGSSPTWGKMKTHPDRSHDLKRKMVFNLHEEVKKPVHTTILEEISDVEVITEMCMETMVSMMKSKIHKRFLHHLNNNNAPVTLDGGGNHTNNSAPKNKRPVFNNIDIGTGGQKSTKDKKPAQEHNTYDDMMREAKATSFKRRQDIMALSNLQAKVAAKKKPGIIIMPGNNEASRLENEDKDAPRTRYSTVVTRKSLASPSQITGVAFAAADVESEIGIANEPEDPKQMSAEEILRTKYLRLNKRVVNDLEAEIRAKGKEPGIHSHKEIPNLREEVFGKS